MAGLGCVAAGSSCCPLHSSTMQWKSHIVFHAQPVNCLRSFAYSWVHTRPPIEERLRLWLVQVLAAGSRHTQSEVAAPHHRMEAGVYVDGVAVVLVVLLTSTSCRTPCQTPLLEAMCFALEVHWTWNVGVNYEVKMVSCNIRVDAWVVFANVCFSLMPWVNKIGMT